MNKNKIARAKTTSIPVGEPVILASDEDKKVFFDAIMSSPQPGSRLVQAAKRYKQLYDPEDTLEV